MQLEKLDSKLRKIILENEGSRDDIHSNVFDFLKPIIIGLVEISQPSGAYSKDSLTHAENTIDNCKTIASELLDYDV